MKALDLFCGIGGASMGLYNAGFEVTGCDIVFQPDYPTGLFSPSFTFIHQNALDIPLTGFDFVWASPPCQAHSALRHLHPQKHYECFIERIRARLLSWGGPFVIENVMGAPLLNPIMLCGSSFGLKVRRHRIFESNFQISPPPCDHRTQGRPIDVSGTGGRRINRRTNDHGGNTNKPRTLDEARSAIDIDWASRYGISQSIPPAYAEFIARQFLQRLQPHT